MKIDYEITVNVYNLTHEEKKRVQDAFFKLGFSWFDGTKYSCLEKGCYTNTLRGGKVTQELMWAEVSAKPTHTVDELLELAGMKTKADLKPFDLERALAGEPVVTRQGEEVTQLTLFKTNSIYTLAGVVDGELLRFTPTGGYLRNEPHDLDLFMKAKTHMVNGFEVPEPVKTPLKNFEDYYAPSIQNSSFYSSYVWTKDIIDKVCLDRGLVFLTKEDAIANAKAMLGIDPYGDEDDLIEGGEA